MGTATGGVSERFSGSVGGSTAVTLGEIAGWENGSPRLGVAASTAANSSPKACASATGVGNSATFASLELVFAVVTDSE